MLVLLSEVERLAVIFSKRMVYALTAKVKLCSAKVACTIVQFFIFGNFSWHSISGRGHVELLFTPRVRYKWPTKPCMLIVIIIVSVS